MRGVGHAITRTTIVLVIPLSACMFSKFATMSYFGMLMSICIIIALLADYFMAPSLILAFRPFGEEFDRDRMSCSASGKRRSGPPAVAEALGHRDDLAGWSRATAIMLVKKPPEAGIMSVGNGKEVVMLSPARRFLKRFHPEGIPWPWCLAYDAVSGTEVFRRHYELLAKDLVRYRTAGSVLDVGTGPARLLLALHRAAPALQLTGVDSSSPMVDVGRRHVADAGLASVIDVEEGNASDLPFPDASFDVVVSTASIHHWKEPTPALNEVHRVLKEGGNALMYDLVSDTPASVLKEAAREFGRLRILLLWLHGFEEPFYTRESFALLARPTLFREGETRFVGVLCCLALEKAKGE